ncbi:hypothetical protein [Novipirellula aureliae]|uniref:hypothetical protein n=1 Tax=Novipirellula aureliae TaxID=2527966 RepID=UPI0018CECBFC|nr:hypothetical protein [Novipirellula aureliae]
MTLETFDTGHSIPAGITLDSFFVKLRPGNQHLAPPTTMLPSHVTKFASCVDNR